MVDLIISMEMTCDLSKELIDKYNLSTIDMDFLVQEELFSTKTDDIVTSGLCEKMRKNQKTSTSQINENAYTAYFKELIKQNKPIIHIGFSSGLSGTIEVAMRCAENINKELNKKQIYVIDSLCGCSGQGLLGIYAREFSRFADSLKEVVDFVESIKLKIKHCYTVENLKYLAAGGRIKPSVALIGKLLNIKPVMYLNNNGMLALKNNVFSRKKSIVSLAEECIASYDSDFKMIIISHADCENDAKELSKMVQDGTKIQPTILSLGPILCSHSGPGTLSLYYVSEKR